MRCNFCYVPGYHKKKLKPNLTIPTPYVVADLELLITYKPKVSYSTARKMWMTYDIQFEEKKVDTCGNCMTLRARIHETEISDREALIKELKEHQDNASKFFSHRTKLYQEVDKRRALGDWTRDIISCDFCANPRIPLALENR